MSTTQSRIEIIDGSEENLTIHKKINGVISDIQIRAFELNVHSQNFKLNHLEIIFVYDPKTSLLGWQYYELSDSEQTKSLLAISKIARFLEDRYIYLSNTKMVFFIFPIILPGIIWISEFTKKYATNDEAYQECFSALLEGNLREIEQDNLSIPLGKHIKRKFFYKDRYAFFHGESVAKISEVRYQDYAWKLVLESYENREVTMILDSDYQVIDVFGDDAIPMDKSSLPKILLVEESERRFDRLPRRLELNDFIVSVVREESERKKRAHNDSPDLILIDMDLTVKSQNAQRIIKELKSDEVTKSIPIIALTRCETEIEESKAAGCDDYEPKPIELPRLLEKIHKCLSTRDNK